MRRLRATGRLRDLVRETQLDPSQFILPLFVCPGEGVRREISSMPGNYQLSIDELVKECEEVQSLGIGGVILFGLPDTKDEMASGAYDDDGIVQRAIRALRSELPELLIDDRRLQLRVHQPRPLRQDRAMATWITTQRLQWLAKRAPSRTPAPAPISWRHPT